MRSLSLLRETSYPWRGKRGRESILYLSTLKTAPDPFLFSSRRLPSPFFSLVDLVGDDPGGLDRAAAAEQMAEIAGRGAEKQVANVQSLAHDRGT